MNEQVRRELFEELSPKINGDYGKAVIMGTGGTLDNNIYPTSPCQSISWPTKYYFGIDPIIQFDLVDNNWQLSVKLPGVTKKQISVKVKIDKVEITVKEDTEFYKEGYQEVYYLPDNSKQKSLKANMKNGVLTLIMNKKLENFKVKVD